jgi:hypothetical protein
MKFGLYIASRHMTNPARQTISRDARLFEITAHHWANHHLTGAHLPVVALMLIPDEFEDGKWGTGEMFRFAKELVAAGLWELYNGETDLDGWHIAAPTIRYEAIEEFPGDREAYKAADYYRYLESAVDNLRQGDDLEEDNLEVDDLEVDDLKPPTQASRAVEVTA